MKTKYYRLLMAPALLVFLTLNLQFSTANAQGTGFTYQGELNNGAGPANGFFDFEFSLYPNAQGTGTQIGSTVTQTSIGVTNGLFAVVLDFGDVFTGNDTWLAISVRSNGVGSYTALTPLQQLTPAPYAIFANTASNLLGTLPAGQLTGTVPLARLPGALVTNDEGGVTLSNVTITGNGAGLTNLSVSNLNGTIPLAQLPSILSLFNDPGTQNFFAGQSAGNLTLSGSDNTGIGVDALYGITSGSENTALGDAALLNNTTATNNTAIGYDAMIGPLFGVTTGNGNTALGALADAFNSTGSNNTACGLNALVLNTTGNVDTAVGSYALGGGGGLTTGGGDTGLGGSTLYDLTTGYNNTAAGYQALYADSTGVDNIGIGVASLQENSTGSLNTAVGTYAFQHMTVGAENIGIGYAAGYNLTAGSNNIYIGNEGASSDNNVIRIGSGQATTYINGGNVGINNSSPTESLDVGGEFLAVEGLTPVRCYIGDDGSGNDVQVGSLKSGITAVSLYNEPDQAYMHLYCSSITIEGGSDLAEPFPISTQERKVSEGSVVIIDEDHPGHLKMADRAYDTRVAGVVSGANGINPGIQMQQQGLLEGGRNVALTGRVYVMADASNGAIRPGDLLTTSDTPGHAMKVTDHLRAQGAILGKAMTGLSEGKGMVLVLVTLQ